MVKKVIKNGQKYAGKFVATAFNKTNVIASGKNPQKVIAKAEKQCDSPVIFYVPPKNTIHVY